MKRELYIYYICTHNLHNTDYVCKTGNMLTIIENELLKNETSIFDYASLKSILENLGYSNINDKINQLKQKGLLKPIIKGLYYHSPIFTKNLISLEVIANNIQGPSYISFEYALSYYGLIPERVFQITSATIKRSKKYATDLAVFQYTHINKSIFSLGLAIEKKQKSSFLIASKEKALCDLLYLRKNYSFYSKKELIILLNEDLRIDIDELENFELEIIEKYYEISKSKRIAIFLKFMESLI